MFTLIFIIPCNVTLMTTIQGPVSTALDASELVSWFTSAYLIAVTSVMPLAGRLSQIFTARAYVFGSILVQCLGLLFTSLANSFLSFILGRVVTGIGAAAVTPVAFILVTEMTSKENRGVFFGCINTAFTSGVACGAIFAGVLEPIIGWRAVFWAQIPFCLAASTVAFLSIPPPPADPKHADESLASKLSRLDFFGIVTLISGVVLLLYSLSAPTISSIAIILALLDFTLFVFVESKWATDPIVPTTVLAHRGNLLTGLATVGLMAARWSVLFYTPIFGISIRAFPQSTAGTLLIPTDIGFALGGIVIGYLHIRSNRSYYLPSLLAFLCFAITEALLSHLSTATAPLPLYLTVSFFNGFCAGAILNYTLAHVLFLTPQTTHVIVIPFIAMLRSLAGSFGSAISGGIFLRSLTSSLKAGLGTIDIPAERKAELIKKLIGNPGLVWTLPSAALREMALSAYVDAYRTMFWAGTAMAVAMGVVQAGTGWKVPREEKGEDVVEETEEETGEEEQRREEDLRGGQREPAV
jgi:MFS family permease